MLLKTLAARLPNVDVPDPNTPPAAENFFASLGGTVLGIVIWLALIAAILAFGFFVIKRNSNDRREALSWLVGALLAYIVLQSLEQVITVLNDVVSSPFDRIS